ncbi:g8641 [Coccomyxa elongata]
MMPQQAIDATQAPTKRPISAAQKPGLVDCARWITNVESVEGAEADALFAAADVNGDGRVDLLELMRAVYKWAPLATRRDDSLAAAQDAALDFFLLLGADAIRRAPLLT